MVRISTDLPTPSRLSECWTIKVSIKGEWLDAGLVPGFKENLITQQHVQVEGTRRTSKRIKESVQLLKEEKAVVGRNLVGIEFPSSITKGEGVEEGIEFKVVESLEKVDLVLGEDWLEKHDPVISYDKFGEFYLGLNFVPRWSHLAKDQPDEISTAVIRNLKERRSLSKFPKENSNLIHTTILENVDLDALAASAQNQDEWEEGIEKKKCKTTIKSRPGKAFEKIILQDIKPLTKRPFEPSIVIVRDMNNHHNNNDPARKLAVDIGDEEKMSDCYLEAPDSSRVWVGLKGFKQIIVGLEGNRFTKLSSNGGKGLNLTPLTSKNREKIRSIKNRNEYKHLQKIVSKFHAAFFPNISEDWHKKYVQNGMIYEKDLLFSHPYAQVCINYPLSNGNTVECSAHRDIGDALYAVCAVLAVSLDPENKPWDPSSYKLAFPQLDIDIELGPGDIIYFPSKLLIHYNTGFKASDPKRASYVFFTHESVFRTIDEERVEMKVKLSDKEKAELSTSRRGNENDVRSRAKNILQGPSQTTPKHGSRKENNKKRREGQKEKKKN